MGAQAVHLVIAADKEVMDGTSEISAIPRVIELSEQLTAVVSGVVPMAGACEFFGRAFQDLGPCMACSGFEPSGAALALCRGTLAGTVDLEVGFAVHGQVPPRGL